MKDTTKGGQRGAVTSRLTKVEIVLLCCIVVFAITGFARVIGPLVRIPEQMDFAIFYGAAGDLNAGQSVYAKAVNTAGKGFVDGYIYPPFTAAVLRPLALLPYSTARSIFFLLNLLLLVLSLFTLCSMSGVKARKAKLVAAAAAILFPAVYDTLLLGQPTIILLFLIVFSLKFANRHTSPAHQIASGVLLGIAAAIKVFPLLFGAAFLFRKRFVALLSMVLAIGAAFLVGAIFGGGLEGTETFIRTILPALSMRADVSPADQNIHAVFARFFAVQQVRFPVLSAENFVTVTIRPIINAPGLATILGTMAVILVGLGTFAVFVRRARHLSKEKPLDIDYSLAITTFLLANRIVHDYYYVLLCIPLFALWVRLKTSRTRVILFLCLLLIIAHRSWRFATLFVVSPLLMMFGFLAVSTLWFLCILASREDLRTTKQEPG